MKKKLIMGGVIVVVVLGVVIFFGIDKKLDKKDNGSNNNTSQNGESTIIQNGSQIKMSNTENVTLENNKKINNSSKVQGDKSFGNLILKDIELYADSDKSYFKATVVNNGEIDISGQIATIHFLDKQGQEFYNMEVSIPETRVGMTSKINATTTSDISNAYDFTIS